MSRELHDHICQQLASLAINSIYQCHFAMPAPFRDAGARSLRIPNGGMLQPSAHFRTGCHSSLLEDSLTILKDDELRN